MQRVVRGMQRPVIGQYFDLVDFVKDMLVFRKANEKSFSVSRATRVLRKVSPTLVTLVLQRKRVLTLDRVDEFAKLLNLNGTERIYFRSWLGQRETKSDTKAVGPAKAAAVNRSRKDVSTNLLTDWLNVFVKDFFQIPEIQKDPSLLERALISIATPSRIRKSVAFLLREGYLRKTIDGRIVVETNLAVANPQIPSRKIRQFHKAALKLARHAVDLYPPTERLANTLIVPLSESRYQHLMAIIDEFSEKLQEFASHDADNNERVYQIHLNVSPVGSKIK